ncbi:13959_t:CDS:2 [Funneliformis caledonium]|uniref:13959_t:CDS:1 n=1 Tax=Funneliformis caledonium TaxID=1117310 RepID=A0A9N8ZHK1_9GLOM|nr:13959_t:CDS:2 [Funneliformis caledonium]
MASNEKSFTFKAGICLPFPRCIIQFARLDSKLIKNNKSKSTLTGHANQLGKTNNLQKSNSNSASPIGS